MKKLVLICLFSFLVGCTTVPVAQKFPSAPERLTQQCENLIVINSDTVELSEFVGVVAQNYRLYQQCSIKNDGWIEWYKTQKQIFDAAQ